MLCAKLFLSCPTLCNPMDCSPPGSSVHGIFQARILEWVVIPSPPGNLPDLGIQPRSPALQEDSLPSEPPWKPILHLQLLKTSCAIFLVLDNVSLWFIILYTVSCTSHTPPPVSPCFWQWEQQVCPAECWGHQPHECSITPLPNYHSLTLKPLCTVPNLDGHKMRLHALFCWSDGNTVNEIGYAGVERTLSIYTQYKSERDRETMWKKHNKVLGRERERQSGFTLTPGSEGLQTEEQALEQLLTLRRSFPCLPKLALLRGVVYTQVPSCVWWLKRWLEKLGLASLTSQALKSSFWRRRRLLSPGEKWPAWQRRRSKLQTSVFSFRSLSLCHRRPPLLGKSPKRRSGVADHPFNEGSLGHQNF